MTNHETLANSYIFYEKYHSNKLNKLVHIVCIPLLVWTTTILLNFIPIVYEINSDNFLISAIKFNASSIVAILYLIYYFYLDYRLGKLWVLLFSIILYSSNLFTDSYGPLALKLAIGIHIFSWILQILSHKFIEGNQPALLSGILQSFTMAPFFVILEILFMFGKREDISNKIKEVKYKSNKMQPFQIKKD